MYTGEHSLTIGAKNTWTDWHLIPETRPVFAPPVVKTKYIEIPGRNGALDLTEALRPFPTYGDRTGSLTFFVDNGHAEWYDLYSSIMNYLHGRRHQAVLADEPGYYYEGRFAVNEWRSEAGNSKIVIDYTLDPFKWETAVTQLFRDSFTTSGTNKTHTIPAQGSAPSGLILTVTGFGTNGASLSVKFLNEMIGILETVTISANGTYHMDQWPLYGGNSTISLMLTGTRQITVVGAVRKGSL